MRLSLGPLNLGTPIFASQKLVEAAGIAPASSDQVCEPSSSVPKIPPPCHSFGFVGIRSELLGLLGVGWMFRILLPNPSLGLLGVVWYCFGFSH
jgi:hypothetical protein